MGERQPTRDNGRATTAGSIAYWMLVGALVTFGLAAMLTIGVLLLAAAAGLAILGARLAVDRRLSPAALIGGAAAPLYIAWLNRRGPGVICEAIEGGVQCTQEASPWPFVGGGVVLVTLGVVFVRSGLRRRTRA